MDYCGAPWCSNRLIRGEIRTIDKVRVCKTCYAAVWYYAQKTNKPIRSFPILTMRPIRRYPRRMESSRCPRVGCGVVLPKEIDDGVLKRLGNQYVCRGCYQAAWRLAKEKNVTMEKAWNMLPPYHSVHGSAKRKRGMKNNGSGN